MAIVIDDLADVKRGLPQVARFVDSLFVKARHWGVCVILSSQKLKLPLISPTVRVNVSFMLVFRLRSNQDLIDGFESEFSSIVDKATLHAMYVASTSKPYGFLYLNLLEHDRNPIFTKGSAAALSSTKANDGRCHRALDPEGQATDGIVPRQSRALRCEGGVRLHRPQER